MKEKIIIFLVGLLLGAIISTSSIFVYTKANNTSNTGNNSMQIPSGNMNFNQDNMNSNNMDSNNQNSNPPELPNNVSSSNN